MSVTGYGYASLLEASSASTCIYFGIIIKILGGMENSSYGAHTLIGPNCSLYTPQHPLDYLQRRKTVESAFPIKIGEDCWLGGNVTVCPGVTIGDRTVIGAGSVVTHDIPSDCMAAGNPCKVIRQLI